MLGLLLIDKPESITSYSAVAQIKRISGEKRIGHTGTLDPMATGILPVLLGRATVLSSYLLDSDKSYIARVKLGVVTDTCDITGEILETKTVSVSSAQLGSVLEQFTGKLRQRPPMFSALKKDGVRLYELARQGQQIEIPERDIEVFSIKLLSPLNENQEFEIEAHVSKGTYIRSLARDIGEALGCGATLSALRRTTTSGFNISECVPLSVLNQDNLGEHILSEETVVSRFRAVQVTEKQAIRFGNGGQLDIGRVKINDLYDGELLRVRFADQFLGLGIADLENNQIAVKCVIRKI